MRIGLVIIFIWALGAIILYSRYGFIIDKLKEQHPEDPGLYDFAGIFVFIFWPFFVPSIMKKMIRKTKEKNDKE